MRSILVLNSKGGSGKTTIARMQARDLGSTYIDTGAMYRAVGLLAVESGLALDDAPSLSAMTAELSFEFPWVEGELHTVVNGRNVSGMIRTPAAAMNASTVSKVGEVRRALVTLQRVMGQQGGVVMEGRDIGTVVFPDADLKIFLSASAQVRGLRRLEQMRERGQQAELADVIAEIEARDHQDSTRAIAPLRPAEDAIQVDTSSMDIGSVRSALLSLVRQRLQGS